MEKNNYSSQQVNVKEMAESFMRDVCDPVEAFLDAYGEAKAASMSALKDAAAAYTGDLNVRHAALQGRVSEVIAQLDECARQKQQAVNVLSAALSNDDAEAEEYAKGEVDAAAQKEFLARQQYDALSLVKLTGRDDFFVPVLDAFAAWMQSEHSVIEQARILRAILEEMSDKVEELRRKADNLTSDLDVRERIATKAAWPIVETHIGSVDFSRAHAGNNLNCQYRFIEALCERQFDAAFVDSPAGDVLMQAMKKLAEAEKAHQ